MEGKRAQEERKFQWSRMRARTKQRHVGKWTNTRHLKGILERWVLKLFGRSKTCRSVQTQEWKRKSGRNLLLSTMLEGMAV